MEVSKWLEGDDVSGFVLASKIEEIPYDDGRKSRYVAVFSDASGAIPAVAWGTELDDIPSPGPLFVSGKVKSFQGNPQLRVDFARTIESGDEELGYSPDALYFSSPWPHDTLAEVFTEVAKSLSGIARECWDMAIALYGRRLFTWPAACSVHHSYRRGLMEHVSSMLGLTLSLVEHYDLDFEVLALGVLFHDLGKIEELGEVPGSDRTVAGHLVGHIATSYGWWLEVAGKCGASKELTQHVGHLILSHHGDRAKGSPVPPATPEAIALHAIDALDANMWIARTAVEGLEPGERVRTKLGYVVRLEVGSDD